MVHEATWREVGRRLAAPALALGAAAALLVWLVASVWLDFIPSPLFAGLRRWAVPARLLAPGPPPAAGDLPTPPAWGLLLLAVLGIGAAAALWWAIQRAVPLRRVEGRVLILVLAVTAALGGILLCMPALPSGDVYSYILYGRISVLYHANPLVVLPAQFTHDPFLPYVYWRETRSVYGPGWLLASNALTVVAQALGGSAAVYVALYKLLALGCHLANVALIWGILTRIAPRRRLLGTLLYAWNPLALIEFAASAHNDALMLTCFLGGAYLISRGQEVAGLALWGLSVATKYVLLLLLPVWLWHMAAQVLPQVDETLARLWMRRAWAALWRAGVVLAAAAVLVVPFWYGPRTLLALANSPPAQSLQNSLSEMVSWPLRWLTVAATHSSPSRVRGAVITTLKLLGIAAFAAVGGWQLWRRARRDVLGAAGWVLLGYLVLASGWFWPWYAIWPLAVVALRPLDRLTRATVLLSNGVLLLYAFLPLTASPIFGLRAIVAFGPALGYLAWDWWRGRATGMRLPGGDVTAPVAARLGS